MIQLGTLDDRVHFGRNPLRLSLLGMATLGYLIESTEINTYIKFCLGIIKVRSISASTISFRDSAIHNFKYSSLQTSINLKKCGD